VVLVFGGLSSFPRKFKHSTGIFSSILVDCHHFRVNWVKGGSVDMSNSQRHTRSGAGRGACQATGAAMYSKLPGLCQHDIVFWRNGSNVGLCKPVVGAW